MPAQALAAPYHPAITRVYDVRCKRDRCTGRFHDSACRPVRSGVPDDGVGQWLLPETHAGDIYSWKVAGVAVSTNS